MGSSVIAIQLLRRWAICLVAAALALNLLHGPAMLLAAPGAPADCHSMLAAPLLQPAATTTAPHISHGHDAAQAGDDGSAGADRIATVGHCPFVNVTAQLAALPDLAARIATAAPPGLPAQDNLSGAEREREDPPPRRLS
ncbi:MAG TPA: hypothetical protein VNQ99_13940 [Xanthobacteraceae bacterium]|nr:hypothetical protein [Xanthobacteraceae bacterium]